MRVFDVYVNLIDDLIEKSMFLGYRQETPIPWSAILNDDIEVDGQDEIYRLRSKVFKFFNTHSFDGGSEL